MDGHPPTPSDRPDFEDPPERTSGLIIETCYRHRDEVTGVHCTRCGRPICPECMHEAPVGYQCPECVREARRSGPRRRVALRVGRRTPAAVTVLIGANVAMFLFSLILDRGRGVSGGGPSLLELGALQPILIARGQYWRLFTVMFLHAGVLHIALNMYGVYLFGTLIENVFGTARFLAIYFVCGFLASVASFLFLEPSGIAVGASGALFGLLGAWVAYNYRRRDTAFGSAQLQWALMLIAINLVLGFSIAGIDNFAHMGGLVAGIAAGTLAEGFGPRNVRQAVRVGGFVALVVLGVALAAWRVSDLRDAFPVFF